jgi:hypothetical protein
MSDAVDLKDLHSNKGKDEDDERRKQRSNEDTMAGSHTLPSESAYLQELKETEGYMVEVELHFSMLHHFFTLSFLSKRRIPKRKGWDVWG